MEVKKPKTPEKVEDTQEATKEETKTPETAQEVEDERKFKKYKNIKFPEL